MNKRIRFIIGRLYDTIEDRDYKVRQDGLQSATRWITKCYSTPPAQHKVLQYTTSPTQSVTVHHQPNTKCYSTPPAQHKVLQYTTSPTQSVTVHHQPNTKCYSDTTSPTQSVTVHHQPNTKCYSTPPAQHKVLQYTISPTQTLEMSVKKFVSKII